jgi:hypothetical protein
MKGKQTWYLQLLSYLLPFILFAIIFHSFLSGFLILMTTDAAVSSANKSAVCVLYETFSNWNDGVLVGTTRSPAVQVASFLKAILSPLLWNNLVYGLACLAASLVFLFGFEKKINPWAALAGALTAFWLGSNFTLLIAGHTFKPYVILFFICSLLPVAWAAAGSPVAVLIWGSCVGLMFAQQPDVALFFALFAGTYLVFRLWREQGFKPLKWLKVLVPAAVVAFLFAAGPLLSGYKQHVKGAAQMQTENKQAKWDYVTQWSFPPEEMIAFIAPGYTGWRSGEPDGPYWGRMGRSPGWERTKQGFQNFKLENTYLGMIPVAFALFALVSCRKSKHKAEILFWSGAMLVALLLSFGKYFPLYSLFYQLPVVNNIRNPNKFLQVFQVCLAVLTAYGFDALWHSKEHGAGSVEEEVRGQGSEVRAFFWVMVSVLGALGLWALSLTLGRSGDVSRFLAQGWPQDAAQVIVQNKITALWHASFMALVVTAVFALFTFPRFEKLLRYKNWIAAGLVLIVAVDAVKLSKHYVKEMPRSYIESNALTDFLKENLGHQRVALLSQQGIYNIWTTYLLPYNRIPTFNFSDMPRMTTDYKRFLETGQRNPLNMWRFSAVKYLLGPVAAERQLQGQARKVFSYDLVAVAKGDEFKVRPSMQGQHAVFELLNTSPRYAVVEPIHQVPDEQALAAVAKLPRPQSGSADVLEYRPGNVKLCVTADAPATLRVAEKWDVDWKASVDGSPVEVKRIDYLCQGVDIPAGKHEVVLRYSPSKLFFYMQCSGYLILFFSLGALVLRRKGGHVAD